MVHRFWMMVNSIRMLLRRIVMMDWFRMVNRIVGMLSWSRVMVI